MSRTVYCLSSVWEIICAYYVWIDSNSMDEIGLPVMKVFQVYALYSQRLLLFLKVYYCVTEIFSDKPTTKQDELWLAASHVSQTISSCLSGHF